MESFKNVENINIFPNDSEDLLAAQTVIKAGPPLRGLRLSLANIHDKPPAPILEEDGSVTDPTFTSLFNHVRPFGDSRPMVLTSLILEEVNLKYAAKTYVRVIGFEKLAILEVRDCERADLFFTALSHPSVGIPPKVRSLTVSHREPEGQNGILAAVEDYLSSFKGLHDLKIHLENVKNLPAVAQIIRHSDTLNVLYVEAMAGRGGYVNDDSFRYSYDDFHMLCRAVSSVVQLGIAFPDTDIADRYTQGFKDRLVSNFAVSKTDRGNKVNGIQSAAAELPKLATLIITTWPNHHGSISIYTYNILCQERATGAFEVFREYQEASCGNDSLRVIALWSQWKWIRCLRCS